jgi:hypothetical protein
MPIERALDKRDRQTASVFTCPCCHGGLYQIPIVNFLEQFWNWLPVSLMSHRGPNKINAGNKQIFSLTRGRSSENHLNRTAPQ